MLLGSRAYTLYNFGYARCFQHLRSIMSIVDYTLHILISFIVETCSKTSHVWAAGLISRMTTKQCIRLSWRAFGGSSSSSMTRDLCTVASRYAVSLQFYVGCSIQHKTLMCADDNDVYM